MAEIVAISTSGNEQVVKLTDPIITSHETKKLAPAFVVDIIDPNKRLKVIGPYAFESKSISQLTIDDGVQLIDTAAFSNCRIDSTVFLPDSVIHLGAYSFAHNNFKRISLSNLLQNVGEHAFFDCKNLNNLIFPDGVTQIPDHMCERCPSLQFVRLGLNTKTIGKSAFKSTGLTEVEIPLSTEQVQAEAFADNENLRTVVFGAGTHFAESAFNSSPELLNVDHLFLVFNYEGVFALTSDAKNITGKSKLQGIYQAYADFAIDLVELNNYASGIFTTPQDKAEQNRVFRIGNFTTALNDAEIITSVPFLRLYEKLQHENVTLPYQFLQQLYRSGKLEEFMSSSSLSAFKRVIKAVRRADPHFSPASSEYFLGLTKLAYAMGVFEKDSKTSQKASEFLATEIEPIKNNPPRIPLNLFSTAEGFDVSIGYHPQFSRLMQDTRNTQSAKASKQTNLQRLFEEELLYPSLASEAYNNFTKLNRGNVQNHGYNKTELTMPFDELIKRLTNDFGDALESIDSSIDHETQIELAKHLSASWLLNSTNAKRCVKVLEEFNFLQSNGLITQHLLQDKLDSSSAIQMVARARAIAYGDAKRFLRDYIETSMSQTVQDSRPLGITGPTPPAIKDGSQNPFHYEFIAKNDVRNFGSSKKLKSCAFIDGSGFCIMLTSMLDPDCQNILIVDKEGNTVGKYLLMINPQNGTALINALYLEPASNQIKKETYKGDPAQLDRQIETEMNDCLDCFLESVHTFVLAYNAEVQDQKQQTKPIITQVNLGLCKPSLLLNARGFTKVNKRSKYFLIGKNFEAMQRDYGPWHNPNLTYGDWQQEQTVIYLDEHTKKYSRSRPAAVSESSEDTKTSPFLTLPSDDDSSSTEA